MKVNQISCPKCKSSLTSKTGIEVGTAINCPKCKYKFAVAAPNKDEDVDDDFEVVDEEEGPKKPASKLGLKPLAKRPAARDDDDDEDEAPRKPSAKRGTKPAARPKPADDEDEEADEAPRKPAGKSGLKPLSKRGRDDDDEEDQPKMGSKAFAALNRDDDDEDDKPARITKGRSDDKDDGEESPRAKRRSAVVDDDDDEDRPRRRGRDDDDEEDDDEPKSGYAKLKGNVYVRASVLGVLLIIMGVLGYLLWDQKFRKKDDDSSKKDDDAGKPVVVDPRQPSGNPPKGKNESRHGGADRVHIAAQGFSIAKPADWQNAASVAGAFLVLQGPGAIFRPNMNVLTQPYDGVPLDAIASGMKSMLPKQISGFRLIGDGKLSIDGQDAISMTYSMRPEGKGGQAIELTLMQYIIVGKSKQKAFILTFTDLAADFAKHRKQFEDMAASVRAD